MTDINLDNPPISDEELLALAESDFNGELPVPKKGESPYYISFYRTIYCLLLRIKELERKAMQ